ncbi:MAG TPA: cob(I)yrinic acid a,c-diamide adenosyltransferase [Hyphomicrobiales bacterium]|nr:cob(I)yrinic acid a,c-diamide adenosyltransferase [Hyphomicrobiales bacterium]
MARLYTRTGDDGTTGLWGGARRPKHDLRIEAIGAIDEANAAIGVARVATAGDIVLDPMLARVQNELFDLGAELAATGGEAPGIRPAQVARLEREIDRLEDGLPPLTAFILPGGTPAAAALHLARTILRRAERRVTALAAAEAVGAEARRYLNRLSDLLFVAARYANRASGDVEWHPGK